MGMTIRELADEFPDMPAYHISALLTITGIQPSGTRRTGKPGRPASTYDLGAVRDAYAEETRRTEKQFLDSDWMASALLARDLIRADTERGELWWPDATRAETLHPDLYGWVHVASSYVPAHRVIWIAADGEIPYPLQVIHINKRRWDNRRANLELVTFGNNIRHRHGAPYVSYDDAVRELAEIRAGPAMAGINPYGGHLEGGRIIAGPTTRRPGR